MKECFECGATEDIQEHHVVPRLRGGTKTVPLCYSCHCKAHGRDSKGLKHSRLVSEGIQNKFETDPEARKEWGSARHRDTTIEMMTNVRVTKADAHTLKIGKVAYEMRKQGNTLQEIAKTYMEMGVVTSRGGINWSKTTIRSLVSRYHALTMEE